LWKTGVILRICGEIPGSGLNFNDVCEAVFRPKVIIGDEELGMDGVLWI